MALPSSDTTFRTPQRWLWVVVPFIVGLAAWFLLAELREREERASLAAAKAGQVQGDLRHSIRVGAMLWPQLQDPAGERALRTILDAQTDVISTHVNELGDLLPGDARVAGLQDVIDEGRVARTQLGIVQSFEGLLGVGARITGLADEIRADQQARRDAARRQTLIGSAVVLLLALLSLVALAARAQRRLAIAGRSHAANLERLADEDALTGLANRRRLDADLREAGADDVQVLVWDLDGFKAFNDTRGHAAGDQLLVAFARELSRTVGRGGRAYRLGGDEFCVISVPGGDLRGSAAGLAAAPLDAGVTVTVGVASSPGDAPDVTEALRVADERMYEAKREKRRHRGALASVS